MKNPESLFRKAGALKEGHFLLASGLHSGHYFQAQAALQDPGTARIIGKKTAGMWKGGNIQVAVSLAVGGIILGHEVARHLGVRHIFVERKTGSLDLHRGFSVKKGERVLIVEDVITTGGSVTEAVEAVRKKGGVIAGITAILKRGNALPGYPLKVLMEADWEKFKPEECPLCLRGIPLSAPGTKQGA